MQRRITGFHQDTEHDWVAELECGHNQHVRHDPPWQLRPWVVTEQGRRGRIGTVLECLPCETRPGRAAAGIVTGLLLAATLFGGRTLSAQQAPLLAVDHVPIAVRHLRAAERAFAALGFRIIPGRPHANGLRDSFIKFADGTSLELISPESGDTDAQARAYTEFLSRQEGGAYLALRTASLDTLAARIGGLIPTGPVARYGNAFATATPTDSSLQWLFFIEYLTPVDDEDAILVHLNQALGIETVWLSARGRAGERTLRRHLPRGSIGIAPGGGAPIVGVTLRVPNAAEVQQLLLNGPGLTLPLRTDGRGRSVRVPAAAGRGVWIEFLEPAVVP